jgi:hypothetical protein
MRHPIEPSLYRRVDVTAFDRQGFDPERKHDVLNAKPRIRCPHCQWQPTRSAHWGCYTMGAPEYFMGGCGTSWHTFDTRGKCPGCSYQWIHTSCLACEKTSLHEAWYETEKRSGSS